MLSDDTATFKQTRPSNEAAATVRLRKEFATFAVTIFSGAFLLFLVQPLIGKFILPWFGGGPGVWTTCLLFFQVVLLAGYAYAHVSTRALSPRAQATLHGILLLSALLLLPITPGAVWKPLPDEEPTLKILLLLTVCLGLPYFVLAATGPLIQAWMAQLRPGFSPYRLYALSNLGSLLALLIYPFLLEPHLSRQQQATLWSWCLAGFVLICGACAFQLWKSNPPALAVPDENESAVLPPNAFTCTLWILLPACASILLLATTNKICLDMAVIPFLWVLPLGLYLLTFILCFDSPQWYARRGYHIALLPACGLLCWALIEGPAIPIVLQIGIYTTGLWIFCTVCHGELCLLKPAPQFLTAFYLSIAAGGAFGGVAVALIAPLIFHSHAELNWGAWLVTALVALLYVRERITAQIGGRRLKLSLIVMPLVLVFGLVLHWQSVRARAGLVTAARNFYGLLRVFDVFKVDPWQHAYRLQSGEVVHGLQFTESNRVREANTYYDEESGVALALKNLPGENRRVGVVGLGCGSVAVYGKRGDMFRFYEINPEVQRLAESNFSFLSGSQAKVEVVLGDARLRLESEPPQQFDLLILDAFSSDAIPIHLLTQEAFVIYQRHLRPGGLIAVHITNTHLDLLPVVEAMAAELKWGTLMIVRGKPEGWWELPSTWVIVSNNREFLDHPALRAAASLAPPGQRDPVLWTDDNVSVFKVLWSLGDSKSARWHP